MKIDAIVIALDETDKYHISEEDAPFITKIEGVYLFDRNRTTNACELTPSYNLKHLYTSITFVDGTSDSKQEALEDDYAYEDDGNADIYAHVPMIDKIITEGDRSVVDHYGDSEVSFADCDYDDQFEAIGEYFFCNRPF